ncbi:peptidase M23 [Gemmobacter aquarius]|uniref:Peptidase M23 n=1 Tax=Paragemmobacter aquarius TaxID=2169400 RepID=A0A2S0UHI7_9RHOB|nr:peptidoglycan DD-metalloendopeptidase family protein [Gemmobacter aquarius]AWB47276.1 peptidase M23 [Gemmobacter aquarius]
MILRIAALLVCLAAPVVAQGVADQAAEAAADLQKAVTALQTAEGGKDRVAALTQTIAAYESGLGVLREALRQASLRETELSLQFNAQRERIGQLVAVLAQLEAEPGPLLMLHPSGPLGTVRSGMMLADVTPALQGEAMRLKGELQELRDLRDLQLAAGDTLARGLQAAQAARSALSQAISERTQLPRGFAEDPDELRRLLESADTLDAFASGLAPVEDDENYFITAKGRLPLPVVGSVLRRPGEADAAGVARPGLTLSVRPRALVTAPWPSTIRYLGPLLDYGNVIILEPGGRYLLVIAGLETVYGEVGEVVSAGAPLGLMGGTDPTLADLLSVSEDGGGVRETETLYMELRQGADPVNPEDWFTVGRD